jgi:acetyl/propionyl-CoA carboxylase alpha subunit
LDAARLSIPHLVFSFDPLHTLREIEVWMEQSQQQFPLILRTVQGGRGRHRVCVVRDHQSLQKDLPIWLEQLRRSFGEVIFFIEKYLETARLISIPFVRFQSGWCRLFSAIDSSLQRQQREVIEICPAEQVDAPILRQLESWTRKLVEEWSYVGVGILEFIVDGSRAYFSRGVAGLTMNFPLWEKISAVQAVAWQVEALKHSTPSSFRNFSEKRRIKPTICFGMLLFIIYRNPGNYSSFLQFGAGSSLSFKQS